MKKNSTFYNQAIEERNKLIRQREAIQKKIDAFNTILSGGNPDSTNENAPMLFEIAPNPNLVGREGSLISLVWDIVKDEKKNFGVKEVLAKVKALGRNSTATIISATLKRLYDPLNKLEQVKAGENRWKPAVYAVKK